jgi:hypothetical protein
MLHPIRAYCNWVQSIGLIYGVIAPLWGIGCITFYLAMTGH